MAKTSSSSSILISVIIPVFNDTKRLRACLDALQKQTLPISQYEIIVVNNESYNNLNTLTANFEKVLFTNEPTSGSYIARNKGISLSKSNYLAFTDSDCIPKPNWLKNGLKALQNNKNLGLIGGNIQLFYKDSNNLSLAEVYEKHTAFQQQRYIEQYHFAATANMFTRKEVFDNVGLFNEDLKSSGDKEWGERVYKAKYQLAYIEEAIVMHPARYSLKDLYSKHARVIGGVEARRNKTGLPAVIDKDLFMGMIPPIKEVKRILQSGANYYEKLQALSILISLNGYSTFERLRLRFGGKATR